MRLHKFCSFFILFIAILTIPLLARPIDVNKATYQGLKPDQFMHEWLLTEPIPVFHDSVKNREMDAQKVVFDKDPLSPEQLISSLNPGFIRFENKNYKWKCSSSKNDIVDLIRMYGEKDYVYSYAVAYIQSADSDNLLMGLGSDDGILMWLNVEQIHNNWIGRPVRTDDDVFPIHLRKGHNVLIFKIQNMQGGWGFTCRRLGPKAFPEILMAKSATGDLDALKLLLANGADPNVSYGPNLTPYHVAQIRGRQEVLDLLVKNGADPNVPMPPKESMVDYLFTRVIKDKYPGASMLIAQDGRILYENGFGFANIKQNKAIAPASTFRIGSITKQFAAAAILKLVEQGKISLQDPLSIYIPDFPKGDRVTIHQLLTHTSGIHSFTNTPDFIKTVKKSIPQAEMLKKIASLGYDFEPGEKWLYNNSGYYILGFIVEKVSGQSFGEFLQANFFGPLEMKNTGVYAKGLKLPHEALGYSYEDDKIDLALDWNMDLAGGAGNLYSSVGDLYRWNEGLFNEQVLEPSSLQAAFTPVKLNDGKEADAIGGRYGYGWVISTFRGLNVISHGGGLHGFNTMLSRFPAENLTVVVLSNCAPNIPGLYPGELANSIAELYLWDKLEKQSSYATQTIDPAILKDYVGRYDYGIAGILEIKLVDDHLMAAMTGQQQFEIFPRSENEFFWKVVEASIIFVRDENGLVTHVIHHQGGSTLEAKKLPDKQEFKIDPTVLKNYIGEYELMPGAIFKVTQEGDQLFVQLASQPKIPVYPSAADEFYYKAVNAQLTFVRSDDRTVKSLILHQMGMDREAKRVK